jgi:hypothetical protein
MKDRIKNKLKMDKYGIRAFVASFSSDPSALEERLKVYEILHKKFLSKWSRNKLADTLTLDNYAMGRGDKDNFCYWIERETRLLGSILGATSDKFKVYFDKREGRYKWIKGYKSAEEVFEITKREILTLLSAAEQDDFEAIKNNKFFKNSHMFRGKILYLYFPDKFLNIFSTDDIDFYLERLGIEYLPSDHILDKQSKLIQYKNNIPDMIGWSNLKFGCFLWSQFSPPSRTVQKSFLPRNKRSHKEQSILAEESVYALPEIESTEVQIIDISDIVVPERKKGRGAKHKYKADYIAESIRNKKLGDQGEEIVLEYEKDILRRHNRKDLASKVKRVSLEDDSLGYDIVSFTPDGDIKYIDVKATRSGIDNRMPFYLTEREKYIMDKNVNNYYLYRIFSANTITPKLLIIDKRLLDERFELKTKLWEISIK